MTNRMIHLGQVGVGHWGKNLLRNFQSLPYATMIAVCDQNTDVLCQVNRQYPALKTTHKYEDLLQNKDIEAIVIATETPLHFPMARAALKAGKHVFVEKPMAQTTEEATALVALAESQQLHLMVGHLLLYHPAFTYVENLIHQGDLGTVYYLYSMRVNLGIIRQHENALESLAPHDLSIALAFLDQSPVAVSAQGQAYLQQGIEDVAFATIFFDRGAIAHLHTSWLDPHKIRKVTVVGSRKMAVIDDSIGNEKVRLYDKGIKGAGGYTNYANAMNIRSGDIHIPNIPLQEPLRLECNHFVDCIRHNQTPRTNGQNGLAVVRLLEAAQQSLRQNGHTIDIV